MTPGNQIPPVYINHGTYIFNKLKLELHLAQHIFHHQRSNLAYHQLWEEGLIHPQERLD